MKIGGVTIAPPKDKILVIPRDEGDVIIKARAVLDFTEFEQLCPKPEGKQILRPGGAVDTAPPSAEDIQKWAEKQSHWMILKSLQATEDLQWDTVDMQNHETWGNYISELESSFSRVEQARIINIVLEACGMTDDRITEATERFLATQAAAQE